MAGPVQAAHADQPAMYFLSAGYVKSELSVAADRPAVSFFDNEDEPSSIVVTIDWGDGSPATSAVPVEDVGDPGVFNVVADHVFADEGSYHQTATVTGPHSGTHSTAWEQQVTDASWTEGFQFAPSVPPIHVGDTFTGFEGHMSVAQVWAVRPDPDMHARIDWGDGTATDPANISWEPSTDSVTEIGWATGAHRYTRAGFFTVQTTFTDSGGAGPSTTLHRALQVTVARYTPDVTAGTASPPVVTAPTTLESIIGGAGGGVPDPTGSVQFSVDGSPVGGPVPITGDRADSPPVQLSAGSHTEQATYSGDGYYTPKTVTTQLNVSTIAADVEIDSSAQPSDPGQPVTFSTFVTQDAGPAGGAPASGTVQFAVDGQPLGDPLALQAGKATAPPWSPTGGGDHQVSVVYSGDATTSSAVATTVHTVRIVPAVVWPAPSPIGYGTALGPDQLDATAPVTGSFTYDPEDGVVLGAGSHQLSATFTPTDSWHYTTTTANAPLTVERAPLTVAAQPASKVYGAANPAFTVTITGFVNGDGPSAVTGSPLLASPSTPASPVGGYPITVDTSQMTAANYSFQTRIATLRVTPAPLTVIAPDLTMPYGGPPPAAVPGYQGFVNSDGPASLTTVPTCAVQVTESTPPGNYPAAVTCTGGSAPNYRLGYHAGTLVVTRAPTAVSPARVSILQSLLGLKVTFSATLTGTATGEPLVGQTLTFNSLGRRQCSATTDAAGAATCTANVLATLAVLLAGGNTVVFDGTDRYLPSAASTPYVLLAAS